MSRSWRVSPIAPSEMFFRARRIGLPPPPRTQRGEVGASGNVECDGFPVQNCGDRRQGRDGHPNAIQAGRVVGPRASPQAHALAVSAGGQTRFEDPNPNFSSGNATRPGNQVH